LVELFVSCSAAETHEKGLVLKELRYMVLEIGNCCGRPHEDDYDDEESSYTSASKSRINWASLQQHISNLVQIHGATAPSSKPATSGPSAPNAPAASEAPPGAHE
jgi:hypothetical protein